MFKKIRQNEKSKIKLHFFFFFESRQSYLNASASTLPVYGSLPVDDRIFEEHQ